MSDDLPHPGGRAPSGSFSTATPDGCEGQTERENGVSTLSEALSQTRNPNKLPTAG